MKECVGECSFWYQLTRVVPDKIHRAVKRLCMKECVGPGCCAGVYLLVTEVAWQQLIH